MDLSDRQLREIKEILAKHLSSDVSVLVFGSRSCGTGRQFSDLDLLISASAPLPLGKLADLREAFSESDLPFRTDIVDRSSITPVFYAEISKDAIELAF